MDNALIIRRNTQLAKAQKVLRAAQYVHMSTELQRYSIRNQAAAIAAYAQQRNHYRSDLRRHSQDVDESAHYAFVCKRNGIKVAYCAEQFDNDGSLLSSIVKHIKRVMAAKYSRELGVKVRRALPDSGPWLSRWWRAHVRALQVDGR